MCWTGRSSCDRCGPTCLGWLRGWSGAMEPIPDYFVTVRHSLRSRASSRAIHLGLCSLLLPCSRPSLPRLVGGPRTSAFLDDVLLAGDYRQVATALQRLTAAARHAGLRLNPAKCELITCSSVAHSVDVNAFPAGIPFNMTGTASLLGAPLGPDIFCEAYTLEKRVDKALPLLRALKDLPDPQTALLLLRHCASYSKVVFATRVTHRPWRKPWVPSTMRSSAAWKLFVGSPSLPPPECKLL